MPLPAAILALASASIVTFAAALLYALRGRRVDDHPICRRCGFDAFGKPVGSDRCSECGADLTRRGATRIGRRERRRGLARVAGSSVFMSAVVLSGAGWVQVRGVDLQPHKPVWWLAREAGSNQAGMRDAALAELERRIALGKAGNVTDAQLNLLLDRALAHQADMSQPWVPGWGLLIETAYDTDRLSDSQWDRYRVQAFALRLKVRGVIRRGDPIPVEFWADPPRLGTPAPAERLGASLQAWADLSPELCIEGRVIPEAKHGSGGFAIDWRAAKPQRLGTAIYQPPASLWSALADGRHTAGVACRVALRDRILTGRGGFPAWGPRGSPPVDQVLSATWTLVPAGTPTVTTTTDASVRPMAQWVQVAEADVENSGRLSLKIKADSPLVAVASDVYVRQGGHEWLVGPAVFEPSWSNWQFVYNECPNLLPGEAEVVLRPQPTAALRTVGVTAIWGGEVKIHPVTIHQRWFVPPPPRAPVPVQRNAVP